MSLKTPLIESIKLLPIDDTDAITEQNVTNNYQIFIDNGGIMNTEKLIEILGGTDAIIRH